MSHQVKLSELGRREDGGSKDRELGALASKGLASLLLKLLAVGGIPNGTDRKVVPVNRARLKD